MIDYRKELLGKSVQVFTRGNLYEGIFEGIQELGPSGRSLFVVLKIDEKRTAFIPSAHLERIYLVS